MIAQMVRAEKPGELEIEVQKMLAQGYDLQGTLLTNDADEIGQWLVELPATMDYILVQAGSLASLERQCQRLIEQGWDFWYGSVPWRGMYLQWMSRTKPQPVRIEAGHFFSKRVVVSSTPVNAANYHWVTGGARSFRMPIPSILEG